MQIPGETVKLEIVWHPPIYDKCNHYMTTEDLGRLSGPPLRDYVTVAFRMLYLFNRKQMGYGLGYMYSALYPSISR